MDDLEVVGEGRHRLLLRFIDWGMDEFTPNIIAFEDTALFIITLRLGLG